MYKYNFNHIIFLISAIFALWVIFISIVSHTFLTTFDKITKSLKDINIAQAERNIEIEKIRKLLERKK